MVIGVLVGIFVFDQLFFGGPRRLTVVRGRARAAHLLKRFPRGRVLKVIDTYTIFGPAFSKTEGYVVRGLGDDDQPWRLTGCLPELGRLRIGDELLEFSNGRDVSYAKLPPWIEKQAPLKMARMFDEAKPMERQGSEASS